MENQDKDKLYWGEKGFGARFFSKFLFTLISVKVWGLAASIIISTYLLINGDVESTLDINGEKLVIKGISGGQWVTFNTTVWALIFGMKEVFRITERKDKAEKEALAQEATAKQELAKIVSAETSSQPKFTSEGHEIVGDEPDGEA